MKMTEVSLTTTFLRKWESQEVPETRVLGKSSGRSHRVEFWNPHFWRQETLRSLERYDAILHDSYLGPTAKLHCRFMFSPCLASQVVLESSTLVSERQQKHTPLAVAEWHSDLLVICSVRKHVADAKRLWCHGLVWLVLIGVRLFEM